MWQRDVITIHIKSKGETRTAPHATYHTPNAALTYSCTLSQVKYEIQCVTYNQLCTAVSEHTAISHYWSILVARGVCTAAATDWAGAAGRRRSSPVSATRYTAVVKFVNARVRATGGPTSMSGSTGSPCAAKRETQTERRDSGDALSLSGTGWFCVVIRCSVRAERGFCCGFRSRSCATFPLGPPSHPTTRASHIIQLYTVSDNGRVQPQVHLDLLLRARHRKGGTQESKGTHVRRGSSTCLPHGMRLQRYNAYVNDLVCENSRYENHERAQYA